VKRERKGRREKSLIERRISPERRGHASAVFLSKREGKKMLKPKQVTLRNKRKGDRWGAFACTNMKAPNRKDQEHAFSPKKARKAAPTSETTQTEKKRSNTHFIPQIVKNAERPRGRRTCLTPTRTTGRRVGNRVKPPSKEGKPGLKRRENTRKQPDPLNIETFRGEKQR